MTSFIDSRLLQNQLLAIQKENSELREKNRLLSEELVTEQKNSATDFLTGLPNRRLLEKSLVRSLADTDRGFFDLLVVLIDLDHFKDVNDVYGHDQGDVVLKNFASFLQKSMRATDNYGRWGGEEFLTIMPIQKSTQVDEIQNFFKRFLGNVTTINRSPDPHKPEPLTISMGVILIHGQEVVPLGPNRFTEPSQVLRQVDKNLYESKKTRNNFTLTEFNPEFLQLPE